METRRSLSLRIGDYRRVLLAATAAHDGPIALGTATAPGTDVLHSADAIRAWNRSAASRWSRLHDAASRRAERTTGRRPRLLFRVAQRQARGADHLHFGLDGSPQYRATNLAYVAALKELRHSHGFGFVDDPYLSRHPRGRDGRPNTSMPKRDMVFLEPAIAGRYLTRYLSDSAQLPAMLSARDHSFRALWVAPSLTRKSGVIVRRLRRVRHAWIVATALSQGSRPTFPVWWSDLRERAAVLRLVRLDLPPPVAVPASR